MSSYSGGMSDQLTHAVDVTSLTAPIDPSNVPSFSARSTFRTTISRVSSSMG